MSKYEEEEVIMISEWPVIEQEAQVPGKKSLMPTQQKKRPHGDEAEIFKPKRSNSSQSPEPQANVAVAKWWRRQPWGVKQQYTALLPQSKNSDTLLAGIMKLEITKDFMLSEINRLTDLAKDNDCSSDLHAALGSFHEKLKNFDAAKDHIEKAVSLNNTESEYKWLLAKINKQVKVQEEQRSAMSSLPSPQNKMFMPAYQKVDRVSVDDLTAERFYEEYSSRQRPVVITGLQVTDQPWTLEEIKTHAGDCTVTLKQSVANSCKWARLEYKEKTTVADYIDQVEESNNKNTSDGNNCIGYLFDWSLPLHCPKLVEKLSIPKYFAGDFLQRTSEGSKYRDSWPSLFVAPAGLCSELHVDAFGSNFWMAIFKGSKRWVIFPPSDLPYLYPQYITSTEPVFEANITSPDLDKQPLLHLTHPTECILTEGEVLFVPAGCPHRVENLTSSIAISANFVDLSNWEKVVQELELYALVDPRSQDLLKELTSCTFDKKMKFYEKEVTWSQFKSKV